MKTIIEAKLLEIENLLLCDNLFDYSYILGQRDVLLELLSIYKE